MVVEETIQEALQGKELFEKYKEQYHISENDCIVLLLQESIEVNRLLLKYLPEYLKRKYLERAIVFCVENEESPIENLIRISMTEDKIKAMVRYYRLLSFHKNIIVASLKEPFGNGNIVGKQRITLEDYVKDAILV